MPANSCGTPGSSGRVALPRIGLAPGGVCQAPRLSRAAGELLPHHFTLTAPVTRSGRLVFCGTFPRSRGAAVSGRPTRRSPDFPGTQRERHAPDRPTPSSSETFPPAHPTPAVQSGMPHPKDQGLPRARRRTTRSSGPIWLARRARGIRDEKLLLAELRRTTVNPIRSATDLVRFLHQDMYSNRCRARRQLHLSRTVSLDLRRRAGGAGDLMDGQL